jgi:hypothetical protein
MYSSHERHRGGEPFDLTILTQGTIDERGQGAAGTRTDIASAKLGAGVRAGSPNTDISPPMQSNADCQRQIQSPMPRTARRPLNRQHARLGIAADLKSKIVLQTAAGRAKEVVTPGDNEIAFGPVSEINTGSGRRTSRLISSGHSWCRRGSARRTEPEKPPSYSHRYSTY